MRRRYLIGLIAAIVAVGATAGGITVSAVSGGNGENASGPEADAAAAAALGMFEEAEPLLLSSYDDLVGKSGKDSRHAIAARDRIIALYTKSGRPEKADAWRMAAQAP